MACVPAYFSSPASYMSLTSLFPRSRPVIALYLPMQQPRVKVLCSRANLLLIELTLAHELLNVFQPIVQLMM